MIADPDVAKAIAFLRGSEYGERAALLRKLRCDAPLDSDLVLSLSRAFAPSQARLGGSRPDYRIVLRLGPCPGRPSRRTKVMKDRQDFFDAFDRVEMMIAAPPGRLPPGDCEIELRRQFASLIAGSAFDLELRRRIADGFENGVGGLTLEVHPFGRRRGRPKQRSEYRDMLVEARIDQTLAKMNEQAEMSGERRRAPKGDAVREVRAQMNLGEEVMRKSRLRRSQIKKC